MDAQKAEYWSEEEGFQAMRRSLISYLRTEKDVVSNQMVRFQKFDGDVDTAVSAFEAAEQGNTDELARILASMDPAAYRGHRHPLRRRRPRRSRAGEQRRLEMPTAPRRRVQVAAALVPVRVPRRTRRLSSEKERNHHG